MQADWICEKAWCPAKRISEGRSRVLDRSERYSPLRECVSYNHWIIQDDAVGVTFLQSQRSSRRGDLHNNRYEYLLWNTIAFVPEKQSQPI